MDAVSIQQKRARMRARAAACKRRCGSLNARWCMVRAFSHERRFQGSWYGPTSGGGGERPSSARSYLANKPDDLGRPVVQHKPLVKGQHAQVCTGA